MSSVCIHGLGYIGLPTAAMLANYGHKVYGYDVNESIRENLRCGEIHLDEPGLRAFVTQATESGQLEITDEVVPAKYQIICVPTPFDEDEKAADLDYIKSAAKALSSQLRRGDTVILESTVPPGTTADILQPILEDETELAAGDDFALVHCPETVLPGNIISELRDNNRLIGGVNGVSTESAVRLYESFVNGDIRTTSEPTAAEFAKLAQNTYRDVNIALANEIARLAHDYDIDSRTVIKLANEHPRVSILQPGPGVGGHCLPIDPWFLGSNSDELDLIARAREINDGMTEFVIDILQTELGELVEVKLAVLGVAYKANVDDTRMSPGLKLARDLGHRKEAKVTTDGGTANELDVAIHDPYIRDPALDLSDLDAAIDDADAIVLTTDHDEFCNLDPERCFDQMAGNTVVDTKACLDREEWRQAGFDICRI